MNVGRDWEFPIERPLVMERERDERERETRDNVTAIHYTMNL